MKKYYLTASAIFIFLALIPVYIKEYRPNYLYRNTIIMHDNTEIGGLGSVDIENFDKYYNNILKLLKYWPESIETFNAIAYFYMPGSYYGRNNENSNAQIRCKYSNLKQKYLLDIKNPDIDSAEKIFLMHLILNDENLYSKAEANECFNNLINMSNNCIDKRYAALATFELFRYDRQYLYDFIKKFPDHQYIPYVELSIMQYEIYSKVKYDIDFEWMIKKYNNLKSPDGWSFKADFYAALFTISEIMNDKDKMPKYIKLLKNECSYYPILNRQRKFYNPLRIHYEYFEEKTQTVYTYDPN